MTLLPVPLLALLALALAGCGERGPYQTDGQQQRDIQKAERVYRQALAEVEAEDWAGAEARLRETLTLDLYHGPAHNNLGVLLLKQGRLYDAAEEFEWARKILPGHPEPRLNLALTLEDGGRHQEALQAALGALEVRPGYLGAIQAIAWIQVTEGLTDETTPGHLDQLIARTDDPLWRDWAHGARLRLANPTP